MKREIITVDSVAAWILTDKNSPVTSFEEFVTLSDDLRDTVLGRKDVAGLAAPQIGLRKNMMVVSALNSWLTLANPQILHKSEELCHAEEGCLSIPGMVVCELPRPREITVQYDIAHYRKGVLEQKTFKTDLTDKESVFLTRVIQHEIDHLNGILITSYRTPVRKVLAI